VRSWKRSEFCRIAFRKKIYDTIDALQADSLNLISGRCVFKRPEPALCSGGTRLNTALPAPSFSPTVARSKHLAQIVPHAAGRTGLVSTAQPGLTESPRLSAATWSHQL